MPHLPKTVANLLVPLIAGLVLAHPMSAAADSRAPESAAPSREVRDGDAASGAPSIMALAQRLLAPAVVGDLVVPGWTWAGAGRRGNVLELRFAPVGPGSRFFVRLVPSRSVRDDGRGSRSFRIGFRTESGVAEPNAAQVRLLAEVTRRVRANDPGDLELPDRPGIEAGDDGRTVFFGPEGAGWVRLSLLLLFLLMAAAALRIATSPARGPVPWRHLAGVAGLTLLAGVLRFTMSPHAFLHEYYHHGVFVPELLSSPGFQANYGEVGPALYRLVHLVIGGPGETAIFATNAVLATLTIPALIALDLALFRAWPRALFAGLILAVLPQHLRFSGAEDPVIPATLFAVASAAFAVSWVDSRRTVALVGAVAATALTMQSRTELMAWPLFLFLLLWAARGRAGLRALLRPELLAAAGVLAVLVLPRLDRIVNPPADVLPVQVTPGTWWRHVAPLLNPFHEDYRFVVLWPSVTPPFLWLLVAAGAVRAWRRDRSAWLGVAGVVFGYVVVTTWIHSNPPFLIRTQVFGTPWCAVLAAGALPLAIDLSARLSHPVPRRILVAILPALVLAGLATHGSWVVRPTEAWQEFEFLREQVPRLPPDARVLTIVEPGARDMDAFPAFLLERTGRRDVRLIDLRAVLDGRESWPDPGPDLVFFQGMFCHFSFFAVDPPPDPLADRCLRVQERYRMVPWATATLDGVPGSHMAYSKGGVGPWDVGLFQVTGLRDP
jgi:hypothetical protein